MAVVGRPLRIVTIVTFLPAFALCIAHGVVTGNPVPAVGLVPLAFSSGVGIFLLARNAKKRRQFEEEGGDGSGGEQRHGGTEVEPQLEEYSLTHSVLVFAIDAILAAALMVVLVFTWIRNSTSRRGGNKMVMLAAYATIPLLVNFLIHLYLAVRELSRGFALHGLMQYTAWQAVPPDCPHCSQRLRPAAAPAMPWFENLSFPSGMMKLPVVRGVPWMRSARAPEWREEEEEGRFDRYRDEPEEEEEAGEPSARTAG